ncbi:MAG: T9SS type A sorting domain-containing protein [Nitrososphaerota archaeon]
MMKYLQRNVVALLIFLFNYLFSQQLRWAYIYPYFQQHAASECNDIIIGDDENLYCVGRASTGFAVITSLTREGSQRWIFHGFDTISTTSENLNSIIFGSDNNIYAAGYRQLTAVGNYYPVIISLTSIGSIRWIYTVPDPCSTGLGFSSLIEGIDGNIYACGEFNGNMGIVCISKQGTEIWKYEYNGTGNSDNEGAYSITQDTLGNLYVVGESYNSGTSWDFTVISLTNEGTLRWLYTYNGGAYPYYDCGYSIIYGGDGNIYTAGFTTTNSQNASDFIVISLTPEGQERWIKSITGIPNVQCDEYAYSIIYGEDGNIYTGGKIYHHAGLYNSASVVSFTSSGNERWIYRFNGPGNLGTTIFSMVYLYDNLYLACGDFYFSVLSLDNTGNENWSYKLGGYRGAFKGRAECLTYDFDGNLYVGGSYKDSGFVIISLTTSMVGNKECSKFLFKSKENFPVVPIFFKDKILLKFKYSLRKYINLSIYNVLGQKIFDKLYYTEDVFLKIDDIEIAKLSKGIYFLKIWSKKMDLGNYKIIKK